MTRIKRPLFGGAIQAFLPDGSVDARYIYIYILKYSFEIIDFV
jgi:hypothetical protein